MANPWEAGRREGKIQAGNQESPSSLSFSGKQKQQSSGSAASLDRLSTLSIVARSVTGKTITCCLLLLPRPRRRRWRPARVRAAVASLSSSSLLILQVSRIQDSFCKSETGPTENTLSVK
ncbi:hypothetical protein AAC387_Pa04g3010 [Persea americana]